MATGSNDDTAIVWDLGTGFAALRDHGRQSACAITHGGMEAADWARSVPGLDYEDSCDRG